MENAILSKRSYVLISPCRNEEKHIKNTLDSVLTQTILPKKWVIVDDGSTDETPEILADYASRFSLIQIVTLTDRGIRSVGPGVIEAFYQGYKLIDPNDYSYLCKLDLDLRLPSRYFETLIERMEKNPKLATCSGKAYIEQGGKLVYERHGDDMSIGASKFYRISYFKEIGGFVREVMWDGIDCHKCRMKGLIACSWNEPNLKFIHLRPMGSSQTNIFTGRMRHGYGQYFMGTSFIFLLASSLFRINQKPYIVGSLAILWGWVISAIQCKPRYPDREFRRFLRRYQMRILLFGKKKVLQNMGVYP